MCRPRYAILAACGVLGLLAASGPLPVPLKVQFRLADGVRISGQITAWDHAGFDGSFGRRSWTDLHPDDLWRLYRRVMDENAAEDWVHLGRNLLIASHQRKQAGKLAEQAFTRALRLDESAAVAIQAARDEVAAAERARLEAQRQLQSQQLTTNTPEATPWPADPWPALSPQEQHAAVLTMRADAQRILAQAGLDAHLLETDHFLLYTDAPRTGAAAWILRLEKLHADFNALLGTPQRQRRGTPAETGADVQPAAQAGGFWGKAVVIVVQKQQMFRSIQAESFRHLVPRAAVGTCHCVGPKTYIVLHCEDVDPEAFDWALIRETTHGLMHRHVAPLRPPAWANEGIAEFMAASMQRGSMTERERRDQALEFIRAGDNVDSILDLSYVDQTWPGPQRVGPAVSSLLIELMIRERPRQFAQWLAAVKTGKDWKEALREDFGVSRSRFVETATRYFMVND